MFAGTTVLASDSFALTASQSEEYGPGNDFYTNQYGVSLREISIWSVPIPVVAVAGSLSFITNKHKRKLRRYGNRTFIYIQRWASDSDSDSDKGD